MAWPRVCDRQLAIATRSKMTTVLASTWVRVIDGRSPGARIASRFPTLATDLVPILRHA
ncbi:hypothetical protein SNOG_01823 [Parastagonospora nodorum SN15]|uniref:Uncharacterized protein n=1 Tax=Phaeosphaeria nodorum (strain SN15 / ATCC MYA-4574 / FGSC 10173) TaxID=321614 RepID=Q0V2E1_PHANO|nr:hypothetical protein SNOG_01823 [Parastagonospora nodorum SN15]EAT91472.1 hypothetical protein SNOG_01823 [Parastagonospora nodorum SN15]